MDLAALADASARTSGAMSISSEIGPDHSVEQTCMFQDSAVAPQ